MSCPNNHLVMVVNNGSDDTSLFPPLKLLLAERFQQLLPLTAFSPALKR